MYIFVGKTYAGKLFVWDCYVSINKLSLCTQHIQVHYLRLLWTTVVVLCIDIGFIFDICTLDFIVNSLKC